MFVELIITFTISNATMYEITSDSSSNLKMWRSMFTEIPRIMHTKNNSFTWAEVSDENTRKFALCLHIRLDTCRIDIKNIHLMYASKLFKLLPTRHVDQNVKMRCFFNWFFSIRFSTNLSSPKMKLFVTFHTDRHNMHSVNIFILLTSSKLQLMYDTILSTLWYKISSSFSMRKFRSSWLSLMMLSSCKENYSSFEGEL